MIRLAQLLFLWHAAAGAAAGAPDCVLKLREDAVEAHVRDRVNFAYLNSLPHYSVVALLIGSAGVPPDPREVEEGRAIVRQLGERGYLILLDGASTSTPEIVSAAPERTVALASAPIEGVRTLVIANPYLLFEAFQGWMKVIASPSSAAGVALGLYWGLDEFLIPDRCGDDDGLVNWQRVVRGRGWYLGMRDYHPIRVYNGSGRLLAGRFPRLAWDQPFFPPEASPPSDEEFKEYAGYARRMVHGLKESAGPDAVVFGSGRDDDRFLLSVYEIAREFGRYGLGVVTGGSGGAMLAANKGVFEAGGESVGVPMIGAKTPGGERSAHSQWHTLSLPVTDYAERLPLLLNQRKLILNAPGGSGTMREIAFSLFEMSRRNPPDRVMLFLGSEYYAGLVSWLKSFPLSEELLARIDLIDNRAQLHRSVLRLHRENRFDVAPYKAR